MLRTRLAKAYIKRTFRPTYGWTQMTPKSVFLDPAFDRSVDIFPGMVMTKTLGENVTLFGMGGGAADSADDVPYGFAALYVGGDDIDEPLEAGINAFAVWVMAPDAEAEILAPAFDTTTVTAEDGTGAETLLTAARSGPEIGKLTATGATAANAVCRLLKVNSPTKITVGGLR